MKDMLMLLLQLIGFVCILGFAGWFLNRFFGFSVGAKGSGFAIPTEWEAGVSFFVAAAVCFGIVYFLGGGKKDAQDR